MDITSYLLGKNSAGGGGGSDLNWSAIGYDSRPQIIDNGYNYAKQIQQSWTPATDLTDRFRDDTNLVYMPLVDTSIATNAYRMFSGCISLQTIPLIDTSSVTNTASMFYGCSSLKEISAIDISNSKSMNAMFNGCLALTTVPQLNAGKVTGTTSFVGAFSKCPNLTDESLDNILKTCISATSYNGTKTLAKLSFDSTNYPASRIQALPHYQDFLDAGWTIGY